MKNLLILTLLLSLFSCGFKTTEERQKECNAKDGKAVLVAYKVSKHSKMWVKLLNTNTIHKIIGMGGRRIPTIDLGDTIDTKYCIENKEVEIFIEGSDYAQLPENRETHLYSLPGYETVE